MPGGMELAIVLLIAVLLFGASKIPKLARSTGQAMGEFKRGREEIDQELQDIREGSDAEASDVDAENEPERSASSS
ncbi:Sec-independent protein translocase subunit TatA/TatB [Halarchaeum sp. P4]|uniref:Sec-independent protein translocase subunit TatA/TatB n=1 Tax=Halarchaeum sp. P4 TaxID=3421639 RepID=UPI003EBB4D1D